MWTKIQFYLLFFSLSSYLSHSVEWRQPHKKIQEFKSICREHLNRKWGFNEILIETVFFFRFAFPSCGNRTFHIWTRCSVIERVTHRPKYQRHIVVNFRRWKWKLTQWGAFDECEITEKKHTFQSRELSAVYLLSFFSVFFRSSRIVWMTSKWSCH